VDVSIPQSGGFLWVHANAQGHFEFPNMALDDYTVSAPAPPHEDADARASRRFPADQRRTAGCHPAGSRLTGVNNPLLNGEGLNFNYRAGL
jgi:hypothetical protein